jgi:hypothetical protein
MIFIGDGGIITIDELDCTTFGDRGYALVAHPTNNDVIIIIKLFM